MAQVTTQMVKEIWFYNPTKLSRRQTQNLLKLKGLHVVKTFKIKKYNWSREKEQLSSGGLILLNSAL